jgi:hypothetical protein
MTRDHEQCPACGTTATAPGQFFGRVPFGFLPAGLRFWTLKARPVPFPVGAESLRQVLREAGTEETRRRFEGGRGGSRPAV